MLPRCPPPAGPQRTGRHWCADVGQWRPGHGDREGESFTPDTKVLLASGTAVPISQLKVGEKVLATSTKTGKSQAEAVTTVIVHHDTDLYDLKIRTYGQTAVIDTTSNHLFWTPGTGGHAGRWVKAGALKYGTHLRTPGGTGTATVLGGSTSRQRDGWMWDLTVPGDNDHDFYMPIMARISATTLRMTMRRDQESSCADVLAKGFLRRRVSLRIRRIAGIPPQANLELKTLRPERSFNYFNISNARGGPAVYWARQPGM